MSKISRLVLTLAVLSSTAGLNFAAVPTASATTGADRVGYVDQSGALFIREGALGAGGEFQESDVASFQIDGDRIAESDDNGFRVKESAPDADWVTISTDPVRSFQIGADHNRPVKSYYW